MYVFMSFSIFNKKKKKTWINIIGVHFPGIFGPGGRYAEAMETGTESISKEVLLICMSSDVEQRFPNFLLYDPF
jgi:hypothetical protein